MKRLILAFVVILISTNILHAAKFNWKKISTNTDNDIFYLDNNHLSKAGNKKLINLIIQKINLIEKNNN